MHTCKWRQKRGRDIDPAFELQTNAVQVGWLCIHLSFFRETEGNIFFLISLCVQLLYGERVLAQVTFASRRHCAVRHEHRLLGAYRSATASTVMFSWWLELSGSLCQLLPSPLHNHTHNKQIFTSPTTRFFSADLSAGF